MIDIWHVLALMAMFEFGVFLGRRRERLNQVIKTKYNWRCPNPKCTFRAGASDEEGLEDIKQAHLNYHLVTGKED